MKSIMAVLILAFGAPVCAAVFGSVHVEIKDPQDMLVPNADVTLHSKTSEWARTQKTDAEGKTKFEAVPIGTYYVSVTAEGFRDMPEKSLVVNSDITTNVEVLMDMESVQESVEVSASQTQVNPESSTTQTMTSRLEITRSPDSDRSGSMAMITNNVPGTYMMHDHLHARGGHGVAWEIDGVPVPNSNLASVGSQFDPKDVDYLETQRGGYSAQFGDRSYGVFNVVPRNGFEGERFADLTLGYGSYHAANAFLDFGSHTEKFAYYGSVSGSRTDYGLERPSTEILHDLSGAFSGFTSMIYIPNATNQFRFVGSVRRDHYQVPNIPEQETQLQVRDTENADDSFANFSWVHNPSSGLLITVSPYYHYNRGHYIGGPNDLPLSTQDDRTSNYVGGSINVGWTKKKHTLRFGTDSYAEHDDALFGLIPNDGSGHSVTQTQALWTGVSGIFVEDSYKATSWLTLNGGLRYTHFAGTFSENATTPRLGTAIKIPRVNWVLRGSYGRYYQHPPVSTISGPLVEYAIAKGFGFKPILGERDETWEVGLAIPVRGWVLDFDHFHNGAANVVDHQVLGNSNLLFPVSIPRGRIRGWESTLRSPMLMKRLQVHWAFSHQTAQARGPVTGGLTDFIPASNDYFYMDHDQRVTLTTGTDLILPRKTWLATNVIYGSGFLLGNGPAHMPQHATLDISLGKDLRENLSLRLSALNILNHEYLTGFDSAFAGTHYDRPREIAVQLKYRFHF